MRAAVSLLFIVACSSSSPVPRAAGGTADSAANDPAELPTVEGVAGAPDKTADVPSEKATSETEATIRDLQIHDELAALFESKRSVWEAVAGDNAGEYNRLREAAEDEATAEIAKKFDTTPEEVERIFAKVAMSKK